MKNKTLRTNSMKLKKVIAASLAISVLFAFTGCGNSSSTDNTRNTSFLLITKMHGTKPLVL